MAGGECVAASLVRRRLAAAMVASLGFGGTSSERQRYQSGAADQGRHDSS
jgi:hypothetical protein